MNWLRCRSSGLASVSSGRGKPITNPPNLRRDDRCRLPQAGFVSPLSDQALGHGRQATGNGIGQLRHAAEHEAWGIAGLAGETTPVIGADIANPPGCADAQRRCPIDQLQTSAPDQGSRRSGMATDSATGAADSR